jgi:hypothetical protein
VIPIQPEDGAVAYYVRNITSVFVTASEAQYRAGRAWYETANRTAEMIADGDVRTGAGVLAALSPQTSWWLNVELACDAFDAGTARRHTTDSCSKANRIMAGENPEDVLPMRRKTGHFYRCIADPSDADAVCIDRHAYDICVGIPLGDWERGLSAYGRYALVADAYRRAARSLGELPSTVQAVSWVAWRDSIAGIGTRGSRV